MPRDAQQECLQQRRLPAGNLPDRDEPSAKQRCAAEQPSWARARGIRAPHGQATEPLTHGRAPELLQRSEIDQDDQERREDPI